MFATLHVLEQFSPGVYENSDLPLTDLERQILELRSKDRDEEIVGETGTLIKSPEVCKPLCARCGTFRRDAVGS